MLFYFSGAFHTIQPTLLHENLQKMQVDTAITSWIIDFRMDRPQCEAEGMLSWAGG